MLFDQAGQRKYLTPTEWAAFIATARKADPLTRSFCFAIAYTGGRLSEILSLTPQSIDFADKAIVIECLKRRKRGIYRSIPVCSELIALLEHTHELTLRRADADAKSVRLWPWSRTTAWSRVKQVCEAAGI